MLLPPASGLALLVSSTLDRQPRGRCDCAWAQRSGLSCGADSPEWYVGHSQACWRHCCTRCANNTASDRTGIIGTSVCLNSSGRLGFPLPRRPFGITPTKQVPLGVRWEDYPAYLPSNLRGVSFVQVGANCGRNSPDCAVGGDPIWLERRAVGAALRSSPSHMSSDSCAAAMQDGHTCSHCVRLSLMPLSRVTCS